MAASTEHTVLPIIPPSDPSLNVAPDMAVPRAIRQSFLAVQKAEGVGAKVRRSIGVPQLRNLTPFLMLDHFSVAYGAGFPDHPHRSFSTATYMLSGAVDHEDFAGNKGTIETGDLQFMTAGRGIVHAEMPHKHADGSPNVGIQLWIDLPKNLKLCEPAYRDMRGSEIPVAETDDGKVKIKVISGQSHGVEYSSGIASTPVWFLDFTIKPGGKVQQPLPAGWNAFAYTIDGTVNFGKGRDAKAVAKYHNTVFEQKGDAVVAEVPADATEDARFILVAGMPLEQEIVQYGPFVTTSQEEVYQALVDFQTYSNGFERAENWKSEIGKSMVH